MDIGGLEVIGTGSRLLTAEDVAELTEHIERLESENVKLREQYEAVIADYRSEVAKLRELVRSYESLAAALCNERDCAGCPFDSTAHVFCEHMRLAACMGELGIEVE